jgi:phosphate transport system substrate-binding protein
MKLFWKIALSAVSVAVFGFMAFVAWIMTAMLGIGLFYWAFWPACVAVLLLAALDWTWQWFKPRTRRAVFLFIACAFALSAVGERAFHAIKNSVDEVGESVLDLSVYEPFVENTKAASLEATPTLAFPVSGTDELPRLDGATALYPLYSSFVMAVYPRADYSLKGEGAFGKVACSGTDLAYSRLLEGGVDIVFAAAPSEGQLRQAARYGMELTLTPIGREAFVFFVNSKNKVAGLSSGSIRDIYTGKTVNWRELGGRNQKIRAYQRPEGSGSQTMLQSFMGEVPVMDPPAEDVAGGMGEIIQKVSTYRN